MKPRLATSLILLNALSTAPVMASEASVETYLPVAPMVVTESVDVTSLQPVKHSLPEGAVIAVARVDGGRLIPTPMREEEDWMFLDRRLEAKIIQIGRAKYIEYVPEVSKDGHSSSNTIDEIRLTAANEGLDYVLIYGVGPDARWASFGGKALVDTGLTVEPGSAAWDAAKAKALLVDTYSGAVMGAVTANDIEFNIGDLADAVGDLITALEDPEKTAENKSNLSALKDI